MPVKRPKIGAFWCLATCVLCAAAGCHNGRTEARKAMQDELATRQAQAKESLRLAKKGQDAVEDRDYAKARQLLTQAVQADDRNVVAWMLLGKAEFEDHRLYYAAEAFHRARRLAPTRYEPVYNLGLVYERAGRYGDAIADYESALRLQPEQTEVMENLARTYVLSGQRPDRARELMKEALLRENRPEWRHWLQMQLVKLTPLPPVPAASTQTVPDLPLPASRPQPDGGQQP